MDKVEKKVPNSYIAPSVSKMVNDWSNGIAGGEASGIEAMDDVFKWMRGFIKGWYGWSNDGKGTFFDFMGVMKAKRDDWKFCVYKQEDMNSTRNEKKIEIGADDIYNNWVWTLTGKTPYKHISKKYYVPLITLDEYMEAIQWVENHLYVIYPEDRYYRNIFDDFLYYYEKFGIDCFLIDPFKAMKLPEGERGDEKLTAVFIEAKELAIKTNTSFNFISHPKSMTDQKVDPKKENSAYKVVNQFMQLGGSAWDINMDMQFSIYRPERHLDPNDPKVKFFNLKTRKKEIVGCGKGELDNIKFDFLKKRYYFDGICPIDGSMTKEKAEALDFIQREKKDEPKPKNPDDVPF